MAPGGLVTLIERSNYDQWSAIIDCAFAGLLAIRTRSIPKSTARWLLESYDPWETSLNLPNGKLSVYDEHVHTFLGLRIGPLQIQGLKNSHIQPKYAKFVERWKTRWGITNEAPHVGSMHEVILNRGDHGPEFALTLSYMQS